MSFDGKNNHLKKKEEKYSSSNNKRMSEVLEIDLVLSNKKYSYFIHWLIQISVVIVVGPHY